VVAHHDAGRAALHHRPHDAHDVALVARPDLHVAVDQIADEHRGARGVPIGPGVLAVAHRLEQSHQLVGVSVHVADDVETLSLD